MRQGGDLVMSECGYAVAGGSRLMRMCFLVVLQGLPGMLVSGKVVLLSVLLGDTMGMGGFIV